MADWLKVLENNFSSNYLILSLYSKEDLGIIALILKSHNYCFWDNMENVRELVMDYIAYKKINLMGDI